MGLHIETIGVVKVARKIIFHQVFCFAKIGYICKTKSDWSNHKKPAKTTVTSRICLFGYPQSKFVFHTSRTWTICV